MVIEPVLRPGRPHEPLGHQITQSLSQTVCALADNIDILGQTTYNAANMIRRNGAEQDE